MRSPHPSKYNGPVATAEELSALTELPLGFIGSHCNTYIKAIGGPGSAHREDALVVIERMPDADLSTVYPGVGIFRYSIFTLGRLACRSDSATQQALGAMIFSGTFPAPADTDLSDDALHAFAARIASYPDASIPTAAQVAAKISSWG